MTTPIDHDFDLDALTELVLDVEERLAVEDADAEAADTA